MDNTYLQNLLFFKLQQHYPFRDALLRNIIKDVVSNLEEEVNEIDKLIQELHLRVVHFKYRKVDGTIREAWGTLNNNIVEISTSGNNKKNTGSIYYYDLEVMQWRQFKITYFIAML